jgi:hypothetical protein
LIAAWADYFAPVKALLIPHLCTVFRDADPGRAPHRALATDLIGKYAADDPELLSQLLTNADARQFEMLLTLLKPNRDRARDLLIHQMDDWEAKKSQATTIRENAIANLPSHCCNSVPDRLWPLPPFAGPDPPHTCLIHRMAARSLRRSRRNRF